MTITAFESSPDGGKGLARDTHVRWARGAGRWALGAGGSGPTLRGSSCFVQGDEGILPLHPFGQIPTYEEGDLGLFETGAIVFIAARHQGC